MSKRSTRRRPPVQRAAPPMPASGPAERAVDAGSSNLRFVTFNCDALTDVEPHALGVTYIFDARPDGAPYAESIRFDGHRLDRKGRGGQRDTFSVTETVEHVIPGSGRQCVTVRVHDVNPGEWEVTATPVRNGHPKSGRTSAPLRTTPLRASGPTGFAPVISVRAPGARLGAWPALVATGVLVGLIVQRVLARQAGLPSGRVLALSLLASALGLVGAKVYYLVEHRARRESIMTSGLCIQGFVIGTMGTLAIGAVATGLSIGRVLDVTAPGLLFGMTFGRFGCFFGGCCAGRPTGSRWGLWSSNRHLGTRRIPVQLLESLLAFSLGAVTFAAAWRVAEPAGTVFVGGVAAYVLGRQILFPLRELPRHRTYGRSVTAAVAIAVLVADVLVAVLG